MEDQKMLKYNIRFPIVVVVITVINILFLIKGVKSADYIVGDEEQWNSQANFGSWSQLYNFTVGDVLVFKYNKEQHNVYEVTQTTYQTCDASSSTGGVLAKYESGNDQIALTEAKKYWFICNVAGHCLGGMRFNIDVKDQEANTTSNSAPSSPPTFEEPTNSNSCIRLPAGFEIWHIGIYIVGLFGLIFT
ncbi:hypothetical protein ACOSQ3_005962 [Xanthoceras sorbifolium]